MQKPGLYHNIKREPHRVLFTARQDSKGPDEGKLVVVYIDLKYGGLHVCDEEQFNAKVIAPPEAGFLPGVEIPQFMFVGDPIMSDADAEALYDGLHEVFTGRTPA